MSDGLGRTGKDAIRRRLIGLGLCLGLTAVAGSPWPALGQGIPAGSQAAQSLTARRSAAAGARGADPSAPRPLVLDGLVKVAAQEPPAPPIAIPPIPGLPTGVPEAESPQPGVRAGKPLSEDPAHPSIAINKSGQVTIHVNESDIRSVLELLSRETTGNILIAPGVQGTISVNIEKRTPEQALEAILRLGNLSSRTEGGLIYVFSPQEVAQQGERGELVTRVYHLNYVRASDLDVMIRPLLSETGKMTSTPQADVGIAGGTNLFGGFGAFGSAGSGGGSGGSSGGGSGGQRNVTGGNSLAGGDVIVIQDFEHNIKIIDDVIRKLDVQPIQVLVEAVIMSIELDRNTNLGIDFAVLTDTAGTGMALFGNGAVLSNNAGFTPSKVIDTTGKIVGGPDPGFPADVNGFKYGFINNRTSGFIHALETIGDVSVLASPRVLVLNKQRAEIQLGQRLGYQTVIQNLTSAIQQVQFLDTGTLLRFRPFVSTDGMIRMEVHPEKSTGQVVANVPQSNTSEVTTNVMVPDGATIVIGGLIENTDTSTQQGTLGLSRMPVIGPLFRAKQQVTTKRELIILLTPRIWNPGAISGLADTASPTTSSGARSTNRGRAAAATAVARAGSDTARPAAAATPVGPAAGAAPPAPAPAPAPAPGAGSPPAATRGNTGHRTIATAIASTPLSPQQTARGSEERHVVRSGENFWTISRQYYGSGRYYKALWSANCDQVEAPDRLVVGMEIVVPPVDRLDETLILPAPASPAPARTRAKRYVADGSHRDDAVGRASAEIEQPAERPTARDQPRQDAAVGRASYEPAAEDTPEPPAPAAPGAPAKSRWRPARTQPASAP